LLFMSGVSQKEIMQRVGIGSPVTIQRWIEAGGWREKRAAKTVTRQELITGILQKIADLIDGDSENFNPDQFVKLASAIDRLDKSNSPVNNSWMYLWISHRGCHCRPMIDTPSH